MRDEAQFRPSELLALYRADVRALLAILARHRDSLTPVEAAVLDALSEAHGIEPEGIQG